MCEVCLCPSAHDSEKRCPCLHRGHLVPRFLARRQFIEHDSVATVKAQCLGSCNGQKCLDKLLKGRRAQKLVCFQVGLPPHNCAASCQLNPCCRWQLPPQVLGQAYTQASLVTLRSKWAGDLPVHIALFIVVEISQDFRSSPLRCATLTLARHPCRAPDPCQSKIANLHMPLYQEYR